MIFHFNASGGSKLCSRALRKKLWQNHFKAAQNMVAEHYKRYYEMNFPSKAVQHLVA